MERNFSHCIPNVDVGIISKTFLWNFEDASDSKNRESYHIYKHIKKFILIMYLQ